MSATTPNHPCLHTLETLPYDMIVAILRSFTNFDDLYALTSASLVCCKIFNKLQKSILTQTAKNIMGPPGAWEAAFDVLNFQRGITDPKAGLYMRKCDITQVEINQRFMRCLCKSFDYSLYLEYPRDRHWLLGPLPANAPSFRFGDPLPIKFFYEMWLLSMQFQYEDIIPFSRHPPLTLDVFRDLEFLSRAVTSILDLPYMESLMTPNWAATLGRETKCTNNLFFSVQNSGCWAAGFDETLCSNPVLQLKLLNKLCNVFAWPSLPDTEPSSSPEAMSKFLNDYLKMSIEDLIKKYGSLQ